MKTRATQQTIVLGIFVLMAAGFALFLPGFARVDNLLTLLQNVTILGIPGLGMAHRAPLRHPDRREHTVQFDGHGARTLDGGLFPAPRSMHQAATAPSACPFPPPTF
jgi:hypothetical protein